MSESTGNMSEVEPYCQCKYFLPVPNFEFLEQYFSQSLYKAQRMEKALNVPEMEEVKKAESHLTSAAAFVDGGIQEACDDACSICLEEFSESDPSTVTGCKHEFHLQCILEWCQRSSQCPMCWQAISLKDSTSQELLTAVERERKIRLAPSRHTTMFYHPTLGEFDLQHFPIGTNNPELEERIIQHLAAAAARGRTHHFSRRGGQRNRSSAHGRPQYLVFSTHPDTPSTGATETSEQTQHIPSAHADHTSSPASASTVIRTSHQTSSFTDRQSSSPSQDTAGPSDFQSISDSLKSRFNSMSMRYRDSISKSTKGWKERLFPRSSSMAGREVQREGITGLSSATNGASVVHRLNHLSVNEQSIQNEGEDGGENTLADSKRPSSCGASSAST